MNDKYIVYFTSRTKKEMLTFIQNKLRENNLGELIPSHGNILTALYNNNGRLQMKEISQLIGKDKSTVTSLVNKLIELDYISKEKSQEDKRISYIILTEKAREIEGLFNNISDEVYNTAYRGVSEEEKEVFLKTLKKIALNFKEENSH